MDDSTTFAACSCALKDLQKVVRNGSTTAHHADVLVRAITAVSESHSIAMPVKTAPEAAASLERLCGELQHYLLYAEKTRNGLSSSDEMARDPQFSMVENALVCLWARVMTLELHVALSELIQAVDFIPRALKFWRLQRKKRLRAKIESGPMEWFASRSERITITERIQSLENTLNAHLRTIGMIKELMTKLVHQEHDDATATLKRLIKEACLLLSHAYGSASIVAPRKGNDPLFMTMDAVMGRSIYLVTCGFLDDQEISCANDILESLERLVDHLKACRQAQSQFTACFQRVMAPCRPPSRLQRRWLQLTLATLCVGSGAFWVVHNQQEFRIAVKTLRIALQEFLTEHMLEPMQAIIGEVLFNQKPEIQDAAALLDTKQSLQRMLADFARDTNPNVSSDELQRIMNDMDMSVVSLQYEKQLGSAVRNLMSGDIVRMLLIQVQFIKKELMVAMGAIDQLMHANQLNLQMLATIPTFLVFGGIYTLTKQLVAQIYHRMSERLYYDAVDVATMLRHHLRDIERLLNKQNRVDGRDDVLGVQDVGMLLLLLHQLRDLFDSHRVVFNEEEEEEETQRFEQDLDDLIQEGLLVSQQLAVIQRMYHSHPFLQRTKVTSRFVL